MVDRREGAMRLSKTVATVTTGIVVIGMLVIVVLSLSRPTEASQARRSGPVAPISGEAASPAAVAAMPSRDSGQAGAIFGHLGKGGMSVTRVGPQLVERDSKCPNNEPCGP
jgi:hypothetical protein